MSKSDYTELSVWKESKLLALNIYKETASFPKEELYGLISQMRRCAISVPSNIGEGCGRNHSKDSIQFFYISRGSLYELETQLHISKDLEYIDLEIFEKLKAQIINCKKLLNGFINYYKSLKPK